MNNKQKFCFLLCFLFTSLSQAETPQLPAYHINTEQVSISGLSSGAFMATQFHVAYSADVMGAGVIAGGPYFCVGSYENTSFSENSTNICMAPLVIGPDSEKLFQKAQSFMQRGLIDDLDNLKDDKLYLFSGTADNVVYTEVVDQTEKFYQLAGLSEAHIRYVKEMNAGHAILTDYASDNACDTSKKPFINDCDFFQAHDILSQIYDELASPVENLQALSGQFIAFDQTQFIPSYDDPQKNYTSMSKTAYLYVPDACETQQCKLHIALHGCLQGSEVIGDRYYKKTGYNEIADANQIIVLYPQVEPSDSKPNNPLGCWDFWGYSSVDTENPNFYTKNAPQMVAIKAMIDRLAQPKNSEEK